MKKIVLILGLVAGLWSFSSLADEEFDPALFPELSEADALSNESMSMPEEAISEEQTPLPTPSSAMSSSSFSPTLNGSVIAAPKFVDDEELNFDDTDNALGEEAVPEHVDIPMIQKSSVQLSNPSNNPVAPQTPSVPEVVSPPADATTINVDKNQALTDNLKEALPQAPASPALATGDTWINKLKSGSGSDAKAPGSVPLLSSSDTNLETMVEKSKRRNQRSNASVFDISGAMLRMSFKQIDDTLTHRGYRRSIQKLDIPNFIRWRNEDKCRSSGVVGYERLDNCVVKIAQRDKNQYVETANYAKYDTKESIEIKFTSNFTNNKAYKISYKSEAANVTGNSQKAMYIRNIKIYDFWKKINQKYGNPDNRDDVIWGLGGNKPYMQAGTGRLILEDPMLRELDYTRMSREDQRFMNTNLYSF